VGIYATKAVLSDGDDLSTVISVAVTVAAIGGVFYWRNYKRAVASAANHTLTLARDAILLRDGPTEYRIPYSAIELLKVRRPVFGKANFILNVTGTPAGTYYGYENMEGLISALASRLPSERVKGRVVHA
jgi:hypothetical protein